MKPKDRPVGVLSVEGETSPSREGEHHWEVPVNSIVAIGEFTNQSGPVADDWFVCFITSLDAVGTKHQFTRPV
jgi:hypothetical protein